VIPSDAVVDLNGVAAAMRPLLNRIAGAFIRLDMTLEPAGLWVTADSDQVEQILLSLVVNACDAMPLGGKLAITTRRWQLNTPHKHRHGVVPVGRWAVLRVTDTGTRLEDAAVDRLLGKAPKMLSITPSSGTDLAKVASVVRRASGHVILEDRGELGTAIAICLPVRDILPSQSSDSDEAPAILVVDGDAWLRTTTTRVLRGAGYGVLQADHLSSALELLRGVTGSCIRVMLVDVDLPGTEAETLAGLACRHRPDLEVLYVGRARAGWSEDLLTKPFTASELLVAVASRLGQSAPR
jgi:two-component system, cell cycle sensor histidine kinase and response regulator CckA